jgi:hypothetical protein
MKRCALFMIGVWCLMAVFPICALAAPVGKFTHVDGQVEVLSPGQAARAVKLGDEVSVGETLRTKSQSKAEVTFEDGSILRLAEKTAMEVKEYMAGQDGMSGVLKLTRGKIQSLISEAASKIFRMGRQSRFEVHTPTAVVGVRGTNFFTYYLKGISGAIFQEGTGYGYNVNKPEEVKTIRAGQAMIVAGPEKAPVIKPATEVEIKQHINDTSPSEKSEKKSEGAIPDISDTVPFLAEASIGELADELPAFIPIETSEAGRTVVVDIPPLSLASSAGDGTAPPVVPFFMGFFEDFRTLGDVAWADGFIVGFTDLWSASAESPAQFSALGTYDWRSGLGIPVFAATIRSDTEENHSQNGFFYSYAAGYSPGNDNAFYADMLGVYLDNSGNAGFVKGSLNGELSFDSDGWIGGGSLYPITIKTHSDSDEPGFSISHQSGSMDWHGYFMDFSEGEPSYFGDIHWLSYDRALAKIDASHQFWQLGVTSTLYGGTFDLGGQSDIDYWVTRFDYADESGRWITTYTSDPDVPGKWSDGLILGKAYESWVSWTAGVTGVSGAELKGTFDPNTRTWQTAVSWAWMDTGTFMDLASTAQGREKLTALNIPCIEIGKTSLTQQGGEVNNLRHVSMEDVTFFAYSTGATPRIWATKDVSGDYVGTPSPTGPAVPLSGSHGITADFQIQKWDGPGGNWGANVTGGGTYRGPETMNGTSIVMNGAAAGKIDNPSSGKFSGTGSGLANSIRPE